MGIIDSIVLGIVEGLTEFLPISSTGHLILTKAALRLESSPGLDAYLIGIQLGALVAVIIHYRKQVFSFSPRLIKLLLIAFLPAAFMGFFLEKTIDAYLFSNTTVALAFIVGGIVMLWSETKISHSTHLRQDLQDLQYRDALLIGAAQIFALWPGMSRSMTTIVGGQLRGLSNRLSCDFSFLLAIPTLGAATTYKLLKHRHELLENDPTPTIVGLVVAFIVAWVALATFLKFVSTRGMRPFAYYRIVVGAMLLTLIYRGIL